MKAINLGASLGVAVRESDRLGAGRLRPIRQPQRRGCHRGERRGTPAGENLTATESQTERYATANLKWRKDKAPCAFC